MPEAQSAGDEMNTSNRCATVGCFWNDTDTSITAADCRATVANDSAACAAKAQTIPLAGLFSGQGIVFLIIMAALVVVIIRSIMPKGKK